MKNKKKIVIGILLMLLLSGCTQRKNLVVEGEIRWDLGNEMDRFLSESVWSYNGNQEIVFLQFAGNVRMVKTTGTDCLENLGNSSQLQVYYVNHHQIKKDGMSSIRNYPYLQIGDESYDFLEIKEDSFTLADFNNGEPCTFTRKDSGHTELKGKYQYQGEVYLVYFSESIGSFSNEETGVSTSFIQLDDKRIQLKQPILSDVPIYRWWEDEKGNLVLLSEGFDVAGLTNEEITLRFPLVVLEKIEE